MTSDKATELTMLVWELWPNLTEGQGEAVRGTILPLDEHVVRRAVHELAKTARWFDLPALLALIRKMSPPGVSDAAEAYRAAAREAEDRIERDMLVKAEALQTIERARAYLRSLTAAEQDRRKLAVADRHPGFPQAMLLRCDPLVGGDGSLSDWLAALMVDEPCGSVPARKAVTA